jgi:hypothetical protein
VTGPIIAEFVGGPCDGRVQAVRATKVLLAVTDSDFVGWLLREDHSEPPPRCRFAVYEVEAPDSPCDARPVRYTFRGFE